MNHKESPSANLYPKEVFWQMTTVNKRDMYILNDAAEYNIRRIGDPNEEWIKAQHSLNRINVLRQIRPNLPLNLTMEALYGQSYEPVKVNEEKLKKASWRPIRDLDKLEQLACIHQQTKIFTTDKQTGRYQILNIDLKTLPKNALPLRGIDQIFISAGCEKQLVNVKRANDDYECWLFDQDKNLWTRFELLGKSVKIGLFQYDKQANEVLCVLFDKNSNQDNWQYYAQPKRLPLAEMAYTDKEVKIIKEVMKIIDVKTGINARKFEQDVVETLLLGKNNQLLRQIRDLIRKQIMNEMQSADRGQRTERFLHIISAQADSDLFLSAINLNTVVKAVLGQSDGNDFSPGNMADLIAWLNEHFSYQPERLSRIIHALGNKHENARIQAFLLKLFVLFDQPNLQIPENNYPRAEILAQTSKTIKTIFSEKSTDAGQAFKAYVDQINAAIAVNQPENNQRLKIGTEGEICQQHNKLEWEGRPSHDMKLAFAIPDALLELNLALKKEKLLFVMAGDSLHTHVEFPLVLNDYDKVKSDLERQFLQLNLAIYYCVNPVDRLFYMLGRLTSLVSFENTPDGAGLKKQNRLGMSLDQLSHQIAKNEAYLSHQIAQLIKVKKFQTAYEHLREAGKNITLYVSQQLHQQISASHDKDEKMLLTKVVNLYNTYFLDQILTLRDPFDFRPSPLIEPLLSKLNQLIVNETELEEKLTQLRNSYDRYGDVSYDKLNQAKENLEAARMVPIDNFFLAGKNNRDLIGTEIVKILNAASSQIAALLSSSPAS